MSNVFTGAVHRVTRWSIALSILMMLAGVSAIFAPAAAGVGVMLLLGWLLIGSGVLHLVFAWRGGHASVLWEILLPAALPQIMTGLQVALPIAMIVAVVAEMLMGGYGLGGAMAHASRFADSKGVFAGIVEIAVVGYVLVKAIALVRRRLLIWHQEAMTPSTV